MTKQPRASLARRAKNMVTMWESSLRLHVVLRPRHSYRSARELLPRARVTAPCESYRPAQELPPRARVTAPRESYRPMRELPPRARVTGNR
jgi:hypothetical protein